MIFGQTLIQTLSEIKVAHITFAPPTFSSRQTGCTGVFLQNIKTLLNQRWWHKRNVYKHEMENPFFKPSKSGKWSQSNDSYGPTSASPWWLPLVCGTPSQGMSAYFHLRCLLDIMWRKAELFRQAFNYILCCSTPISWGMFLNEVTVFLFQLFYCFTMLWCYDSVSCLEATWLQKEGYKCRQYINKCINLTPSSAVFPNILTLTNRDV